MISLTNDYLNSAYILNDIKHCDCIERKFINDILSMTTLKYYTDTDVLVYHTKAEWCKSLHSHQFLLHYNVVTLQLLENFFLKSPVERDFRSLWFKQGDQKSTFWSLVRLCSFHLALWSSTAKWENLTEIIPQRLVFEESGAPKKRRYALYKK